MSSNETKNEENHDSLEKTDREEMENENIAKDNNDAIMDEIYDEILENIPAEESVDDKVKRLEKELKDKDEELIRKAADLDNYRKRLIKESDDKVKYANKSMLETFIPVLDNIEMTLQHITEDSPLKQGIELTIKSFKDTLARFGVEEIDSSINSKFDPAIHEALMMDNNPEFENNTVTLSVQKGYSLNGRVIRAAKVKVNKL